MSSPTEQLTFHRGPRISFEGTIGRQMAEGGYGLIFEARRRPGGPDDVFVVKSAKPGAEKLLEIERRASEILEHANVARYLGVAESAELGKLLAYERLAPNPLLALNAPGARPRFRDPGTFYYPLPPGRALELAFDLVHALAYIHARGFVHGDVKLANFMVRTRGPSRSIGELLGNVAAGEFEGALIDLSSLRSVRVLEEIAHGKRARAHGPAITPLYAPPEAVVERRGGAGSVVFSKGMDVYAAGLVLYALVTGRAPYGGACAPSELRDPDVMREIKAAEGRGELSPIDDDAFDAIPLHDVVFTRGARHGWPIFRSCVAHLVRRCLDHDPARRITAVAARDYLARELLVLPAGPGAKRRFGQGLFDMRPLANRLTGDAPRGGIRVVCSADEVRAEEAAPPAAVAVPKPAPRRTKPLWFETEGFSESAEAATRHLPSA
ncbi:MAG TPA: protein kinase [Planctomycetota bacterium]|nr:protein kinase [Planctomycetota bacterium]